MVAAFERISRQGLCVARAWVAVILACGASATGVALAPPVARAGEYHVYTCRTPDGEAAPADGWSPSAAGTATVTKDTCSQPGGALITGLVAQTSRWANTNTATWEFEAPAGETLAAATLWRAGDADGGAVNGAFYNFWFAGPADFDSLEAGFGQCIAGSPCPEGVGDPAEPLSVENILPVPTQDLGARLYVNASCSGESNSRCKEDGGDSNGYAAVVYLYAADLTLEQHGAPTAFDVSGELASNPTVAGTTDLAFTATTRAQASTRRCSASTGRWCRRTVA